MEKMSKLFEDCAWNVAYTRVGDQVDYAFVEKKDTLYIFFEGSNGVTDWIRNFLFKKKPYKDMDRTYRVHRGFLAAWKEVEDIIIKKITELKEDPNHVDGFHTTKELLIEFTKDYKWKNIVVVGYSHGGALAAFCHECVWYYRPDLREKGLVGYGFEAPRIFGGFYVPADLKERWATFTVTRNGKDIVTYCPPCIFGYCHVGSILKIGKHEGLIKDHYPDRVYNALVEYEDSQNEKN